MASNLSSCTTKIETHLPLEFRLILTLGAKEKVVQTDRRRQSFFTFLPLLYVAASGHATPPGSVFWE